MKTVLSLAVVALVLGGPVMAQPGQPDDQGKQDLKAKVDLCVQRGVELRKNGQIDTAQGMFQAALMIDGTNVQAMAELAWVHNRKKEYATAERIARQAVRLKKTNCDALRELGVAVWSQNRPVEAAAAFLLAIDANPRDLPSYLYMESLLREQRLYEQADEIRQKRDRMLARPRLEL